MQMDLKRVFDIPGESVAFSHELDLRDVEQWGRKPFASPVHVTGVCLLYTSCSPPFAFPRIAPLIEP